MFSVNKIGTNDIFKIVVRLTFLTFDIFDIVYNE